MVSKKVVQDIVPSSRRSIKLIPLKKKKNEEEILEIEEIKPIAKTSKPIAKARVPRDLVEEEEIEITTRGKKNGKKKYAKILIFFVILICITLISIALSLLYSKAIITVVPEKVELNVNGSYIAKKDNVNDDTINYQIVTISSEANKSIVAVDGPATQTKAKGVVTLFNSFSSSTQKIVAGTRLSNSNGQIYKTIETVVIPGKKITQGKLVLGTISVGVIADKEGTEYNMKYADLTSNLRLPGYKGTPKYDAFYGKLKTEILGGFSGKTKVISPELEKNTIDELNKAIESKLLSQINSVIPKGYVMFDKAYTIDYQRISSTTNTKNTSTIAVRGTLYSIIFNSKTLIDYIAKKQIADSRLTNYKVDGLEKLSFKIINSKDFSPKKENTLSFSLNGPIKIVGNISEPELKNKLLGIKVKEIDSVIKDNPSVKYATVLLTPFWMRNFPSSVDNIFIEYK